MGRLIALLLVALLAQGMVGCAPTIDKVMGWSTGDDCKLDRIDRGQAMCVKKTELAVAPLYCYKTIGGMECYAQPDRFADNRAPVSPPALPANTLAARDMPAGTVPGSRPVVPDLALANPDGRDGAQDAVRRETAALNARLEAERIAVAVPLPPTLSEPLIEPPKVEEKKAPPKRPTVRRSAGTGRPTPITRPGTPAARPASPGTESARPMTDAEGAALADRQRQ